MPISARFVAAFALLTGCFEDAPGPVATTMDATDTAASSGGASSSGSPESSASQPDSDASSGTDASTSGPGSSDTTGATDGSSSGTGAVPTCGDGVVDDDEMCDGGAGCRDCVFTDYACNPLNDAGCGAGTRCGLVSFENETFGCMAPGSADLGEACGAAAANDGDCAADLTCLFNGQTPLCDIGSCCARYCNVQEADPGCADGEICFSFFPTPQYAGLEHLGYCGA